MRSKTVSALSVFLCSVVAILCGAHADGQSTSIAIPLHSNCAIEPHKIAINPDVIECFARYAPLPEVPQYLDETTPEKLRAQGEWLIRQLDRPAACGKDAKLRSDQACAIIVYELDERFRQADLPFTVLIKIYRISHPERIEDTILYAMNHSSSERRIGAGAEPIWHLLAEIRASQRCQPSKDNKVGTGIASSGMSLRSEPCRRVGDDVRYRPMLLIGRGEAERVFNESAAQRHFKVPLEIRQKICAGYGSCEN